MTDRATRLNGLCTVALALLLAGCGSAEEQAADLDSKVAAAEKAADRAERAQRRAEAAALAGSPAPSPRVIAEEEEAADIIDEDIFVEGSDDSSTDDGSDEPSGDEAREARRAAHGDVPTDT